MRRLICGRTILTVPVKFSQTVRFNVYVGSGSPSLLKVPCRILDLDPTAGRDLLLLLRQAKDVRIWNVPVRRHFGLFVCMTLLRRRNGTPKDVGILGRNVLEIRDAETEILSDNLDWGVDEPVGKHESGPGGIEITVRKDQEEFKSIIQRLDTMGKVPGESGGMGSVTATKHLVGCSSRKYIWVRTVSWAFDITDVRPPLVIKGCNSSRACK